MTTPERFQKVGGGNQIAPRAAVAARVAVLCVGSWAIAITTPETLSGSCAVETKPRRGQLSRHRGHLVGVEGSVALWVRCVVTHPSFSPRVSMRPLRKPQQYSAAGRDVNALDGLSTANWTVDAAPRSGGALGENRLPRGQCGKWVKVRQPDKRLWSGPITSDGKCGGIGAEVSLGYRDVAGAEWCMFVTSYSRAGPVGDCGERPRVRCDLGIVILGFGFELQARSWRLVGWQGANNGMQARADALRAQWKRKCAFVHWGVWEARRACGHGPETPRLSMYNDCRRRLQF